MSVKRAAIFILTSLLLCIGGAAWLLTLPVPLPPVLRPTAVQVAVTRRHLAALDQAVSRPGPRTFRFSENDLNVLLSSSKAAQALLMDHGIGAVQIELQEPNVLIVHAAMRVHGFWQNVQISGTLVPDPKTGLRFDAFRAQDGRFPLPLSFVAAQTAPLAARFSPLILSRLALSVESVRVEKKDLVIVGLPVRPASPQSASPARH